jgi:hypothetical protein
LCFVAIHLYFRIIQRGLVHGYSAPEEAAALKLLVTLSIVFLCNVVLALVGLGLGVAGLIRSRRYHLNRLFRLLGISLNGLVLLAFGAMTAFALVNRH